MGRRRGGPGRAAADLSGPRGPFAAIRPARWWPLGAVALACWLAPRSPGLGIPLLLAAGLGACLAGARALTPQRALAAIVGGACVTRAAAAVFLYAASAGRWPVLRELQTGDGFWRFAPDSRNYHVLALEALRGAAATGGFEATQDVDVTVGLVAAAYALFGVHPLAGVILNVWVASASALLAFVLARQLGGTERQGLLGAALVGFWPSTLVWSAQLLKDPLILALVLAALVGLAGLVGPVSRGAARRLGALGLAVAALFFLAKLRLPAGRVLLVACVLALAIALVRRPLRRLALGAAVVLLAVVVVVGAPSRALWFPLGSGRAAAVLAGHAVARLEVPQHAERRFEPKPAPLELHRGWLPSMLVLSLRSLTNARDVSARWEGNLATDPRADISTPAGLLRHLPEFVAAGLLSPYPWRWHVRGQTGAFRALAPFEMVLLAAALPGLALGAWRVLKRRSWVGVATVTFGLGLWLMVAVVVVNEGTLFRLRLLGVLPLLVAAAAGGGFDGYARWARAALRPLGRVMGRARGVAT